MRKSVGFGFFTGGRTIVALPLPGGIVASDMHSPVVALLYYIVLIAIDSMVL